MGKESPLKDEVAQPQRMIILVMTTCALRQLVVCEGLSTLPAGLDGPAFQDQRVSLHDTARLQERALFSAAPCWSKKLPEAQSAQYPAQCVCSIKLLHLQLTSHRSSRGCDKVSECELDFARASLFSSMILGSISLCIDEAKSWLHGVPEVFLVGCSCWVAGLRLGGSNCVTLHSSTITNFIVTQEEARWDQLACLGPCAMGK